MNNKLFRTTTKTAAIFLAMVMTFSMAHNTFAAQVQNAGNPDEEYLINVSLESWIYGQEPNTPVVTVPDAVLEMLYQREHDYLSSIGNKQQTEGILQEIRDYVMRVRELLVQFLYSSGGDEEAILEELEIIIPLLGQMNVEAQASDPRVPDFFGWLSMIDVNSLVVTEALLEASLDCMDEINDFRIILGNEQNTLELDLLVLRRKIGVLESVRAGYIATEFSPEIKAKHKELDKIHALLWYSLQATGNTSKSYQDSISFIQTAEGGLQEMSNMAYRIVELLTDLLNGTIIDTEAAWDELDQLIDEMYGLYTRVEFNRKPVFDSRLEDYLELLDIIYRTSPATLEEQLEAVNTFLNEIQNYRSEFQAGQNMLEFQIWAFDMKHEALSMILGESVFFFKHFPKNEIIDIDSAQFNVFTGNSYLPEEVINAIQQRLNELNIYLNYLLGEVPSDDIQWQIYRVEKEMEALNGLLNAAIPDVYEALVNNVHNEMLQIEGELSDYYAPFEGKIPIAFFYKTVPEWELLPGVPTQVGEYIVIAVVLDYSISDILAGIDYFYIYEMPCPSHFEDHEGNYITVTRLAGMCWTSNMKNRTYTDGTAIPFAKTYQNDDAHAQIFGLLYDWHSAVGRPSRATFVQGICPDGWHVPTKEELLKLSSYSAAQLKSENYWIHTSGTDDFGFTSLPAGMYNTATVRFVDIYGATGYWSCTPMGGTEAFAFVLNYYCEYIQETLISITDGYSVRCVFDNDR